MWDLIVSVPDHCLSFYFVKSLKPLSDCHDISGDMQRYKASYNSACIAADVHEL